MTEINLATATQAEMKAWAKNELDLNLTMNMSEDTMRDRILAKCAELQIEPPTAELELKGAKTNSKAKQKQKRFKINIAKQDKDGGAEPAFVGVQGVGYLIPRGIDIIVPESVVEVLKNAKQDIVTQDPDSGEMHHEEVMTYPFMVLGEAA